MANEIEEYTIGTYKNDWRKNVYNILNVILANDNIEEYDNTKTYNTDDIVYVSDPITSAKKLFKSLIDDNTEPVNNNEAWQERPEHYITDEELQKYLALTLKILPQSVYYLLTTTDENEVVIRDYVIGLYMSCFLANVMTTETASTGGTGSSFSIVKYLSIDGLTASYQIPDWALEERNIFFNNPFGAEILGLYKKLFTSTPIKTHKYFNDIYSTFRFRGRDGLPFRKK